MNGTRSMQYAELSVVKQRVLVGNPLPFNVRDADRSLLLARGHVVASHEQMEALFERGALVDLDELKPQAEDARSVPRERLPELWRSCLDDVSSALQASPHPGYTAALDDAAAPVLALIERDPDLAIFQVLRQEESSHLQYGVTHSVHAAITVHMVAQRLRWDAEATQRVFKAALTMNLSMLEMQGELARQSTPLSDAQRAAIHSHPQRSVEMLELAGVSDRDWLDTIAQHHEVAGGTGYPAGLSEVSEAASLLRRADIYTAKLSGRAKRDAMTADQAGRQMFMQDPGHPMSAALAKEFGVYPPGCHVALVTGELAIVIQRGQTVTTPIVAAITNERGAARDEPVRRDTSRKSQAIVGVVADRKVTVRVPTAKLMSLASG
jgi:HD-GYP domain-containing protein (c-di-GMP phosphodiesterase class II)